MAVTSKTWTYTLAAGSITIDGSYALNVVSILATSGSVQILGTLMPNGVPSTPIILQEGEAGTISAGSNNSLPLDSVTITTLGVASLMGR